MVCAVVPAAEGRLLLATGMTFPLVDADGAREELARPKTRGPAASLHGLRVRPRRPAPGWMAVEDPSAAGTLVCLEPDGASETPLEHVEVHSGISMIPLGPWTF